MTKPAELALGLMSGTSADGVSAALASFSANEFKFLGLHHRPYPDSISKRIYLRGDLSAAEVSRLNMEIGEEFAAAALQLLKKLHIPASRVACIGSHGQTLYHGPRDGVKNTLQVGDPAVIAERTDIDVVSHFRQRDIAVGGEGAPLIPFFDHFFYGRGPARAFQNIGGIANVTVVGKGIREPFAFDTGPGNCLMDLAVRLATGGKDSYDAGGQRAKHGTIDMPAIARMMEDDYLKLAPPKSTGPEHFSEAFLKKHLGDRLHSHTSDVLATLNYFTCLTIQETFRSHIFNRYPVNEVVVSGGGAYNKTLMKKLECLFAPIPVRSIESLGMPAQAKEPLAFAFFGLRCLRGKINHAPSSTGAREPRVLGSITRA